MNIAVIPKSIEKFRYLLFGGKFDCYFFILLYKSLENI